MGRARFHGGAKLSRNLDDHLRRGRRGIAGVVRNARVSQAEGIAMTRRTQFVVIAICLLLIPSIASACPVCYGSPTSPMTKSTNKPILFFFRVGGFVQGGFIALFWTFWRRAKELRHRRESFSVVDGGAAQ